MQINIQEFMELAKSENREYEYYGLRIHHGAPVEIGEELPNSFIWDNGDWTEDELDGTCAIDLRRGDVEKLLKAYTYLGAPIVIAGMQAGYGDDDGEIVIRHAVRIA